MGGDGSVAELCHAMVLRAQLDADSPVRPVKPVLPLGIVPAGERSRGDATESVDVVGNVSKVFRCVSRVFRFHGRGVLLGSRGQRSGHCSPAHHPG